MKTRIALILLAALLILAACGNSESPAEKAVEPVNITTRKIDGVPNPWRDVTEEEAKATCPASFVVPEGATDVAWSIMDNGNDPPLVQLVFTLDRLTFTAREQVTGETENYDHGLYYEWTVLEPFTITEKGVSGTCSRFIAEEEMADLMTWYDAEAGVSYSVSVCDPSLDGFDLQAIVEQLIP